MSTKQINNLAQLTDKYDIFFVDLWGVIHDGIETYPGVNDALLELQKAGKKVVFISNAPRRAQKAVDGLRNLGVQDGLYADVVTSGEVLFEHLRNHTGPLASMELAKKYIILGPERDAGLADGAGYVRVMDINNAGFIIVTGFDHDDSNMEEMQPYLDEAIKLNLPMICANPDLVVVRLSGARALCAGVIAKKYAEMGGKVIYFGKPYRAIYERAMQLIGNDSEKNRIAAIGDSLITDILGANNFGLDSYFIAGGISGNELGITHGELPDADILQKYCENYGIKPVGVLPRFVF